MSAPTAMERPAMAVARPVAITTNRQAATNNSELRVCATVVVRKEANERTETVRDTLRETRVDLDKDDAGRAATVTTNPVPIKNP